MIETLTFSQCLSKVMKKHKLTVQTLSILIGKRADLKHVLADDATSAKRSALFDKLKESMLFDEDDYQKLSQALEVSRLGVEWYRFQKSIRSVLAGHPFDPPQDILTPEGQSLASRLQTLNEAEKIEIICFNCCYHTLFSSLRPLFEDQKRDIHMRHYIQSTSSWSAAAEFIAAVLPLIFDSRYVPYIRHPSVETQIPSFGGNTLLIRAIIRNEIIEHYFVIANNTTAFELSNVASSHLFSFVSNVLAGVHPEPLAIKEEYPYKLDFPSLCMTFLSHELNRATYSITNDLCFQQIPTDIAVAAFTDGGLDSSDEVQKVIQRTLSIHEQRYQNQYNKKKPTYRVMTIEGCRQFLATGKTTDHFVGFRAFTPEERKTIFGNMLAVAHQNPFFIPLLLKGGVFTHQFNLVCYDKLGVSIDAKDTDYDISSGYRSVFLMYPAFTKMYMKYYLDIIVGENCYSKHESLEMLEKMYQEFLIEHHLT